MRISDWSSDVCSSDLTISHEVQALGNVLEGRLAWAVGFFHSKEVSDGGLSYSLFGDPSLPFSDDRNNFTSIDQNRSATGVYFQSTLALPDALKLTGGLRFNKDEDRKRVVEGKSVSVRVDLGG